MAVNEKTKKVIIALTRARNQFLELTHSERAALITFYSHYPIKFDTAYGMDSDQQSRYLTSVLFKSVNINDILNKIAYLHRPINS